MKLNSSRCAPYSSLCSTLLTWLSILISLTFSLACEESSQPVVGPLNDGSGQRTQIAVISDIHLGADLAYAECEENLPALVAFLNDVADSPTVRELVFAGDMLDEWFIPATTDTYDGKDQADFVQRIATVNSEVIGTINRIIEDGDILVTYIPGNHDLTITAENVDSILPGINQARDDIQGLGTYFPLDHPEIAIEHGHRYNFFCAPDPLSNATIAPDSILPPGYFFTRFAALHVAQQCETAGDTIPEVTPNAEGGSSQELAYAYWNLWKALIESFPIENNFDDPVLVTNIDGFSQTYAVNDLLPFQEVPGGLIDMNLYKGAIDNWDERQTHNHVAVHIPTMQALMNAAPASGTDDQAELQYFSNPESNVRIVVFGHTHMARIIPGENHAGLKTIYANSGTWIDHNNLNGSIMNFIVITPQGSSADSQTAVKLYRLKDGSMEELAADSVRL